MMLVWLAALAVIGWRWLVGRWPWVPASPRIDATREARALLGLAPGADRAQILAAHRALLGRVHPDRGGTSEGVYAADAARDLLLAEATWEQNRA